MWIVDGNTVRAVAVNIGQSDGTNTEIPSGLKEGQKVVVAVKSSTPDGGDTDDAAQESSPFAPGPKNNKKKG